MKAKWNERLFFWIRDKLLQIPIAASLPKKYYWLAYLLMPITAIRNAPNSYIRYEPWDSAFMILGKRYDENLFRNIKTGQYHDCLLRVVEKKDKITFEATRIQAPFKIIPFSAGMIVDNTRPAPPYSKIREMLIAELWRHHISPLIKITQTPTMIVTDIPAIRYDAQITILAEVD